MKHRPPKNRPTSRNQSVKTRDYSLDNLRSFLTALVIIHHTAVFYGGFGHGPLRSSCFAPSSPILIAFNALNQSFFIGLFFYLSGRFAQSSLERESETKARQIRFIKGRLLRILLPAIFYTLFLHPALEVIKYVCGRDMGLGSHGRTNWATQIVRIYWNSWTDGRGIKGPVWYLGLLFIFDALSMVAPHFRRNRAHTGPRISKTRMLQLYLLVVLTSFTIRIFYPVGTALPIFSVQPGYLPQYVFAYIVGRLSVIYGDVLLLDISPLRCGPKLQLASSVVFQLVLGLVVGILTVRTASKSDDLLQLLIGGLNLPALLYAAWNEVGLALVGSSLIALFANHVNFPIYLDYAFPRVYGRQNGMAGDKVKSEAKSGPKQSSPRPLIARYSYAAFLVHPLVSLAVEILVDGICDEAQSQIWKLLGPVFLTIIVGAMNVAASWGVAYLICHYIPGLGRIL